METTERSVADLVVAHPPVSGMVDPLCLKHLLSCLDRVLENGVEGDVTELGCHEGTAALFLRRLLDLRGSAKELHVYDSFDGLPEKRPEDVEGAAADKNGWPKDYFQQGSCRGSREMLLQNFREAGLVPPVVHAGWFRDADYPQSICFSFFDGDFYSSIRDSFELVYPRLKPHGVLCIHDYGWSVLPGIRRACEEFLRDKPEEIRMMDDLAVLWKLP